MNILNKIEKINDKFSNDELLLDLLKDVLDLANDYVKKVNMMETRIRIASLRLDPSEYRIQVQEMDTARRRTHNALIRQLNAFDRLMRSENSEDLCLFNGDYNDRYEIANWAGEICHILFTNRGR